MKRSIAIDVVKKPKQQLEIHFVNHVMKCVYEIRREWEKLGVKDKKAK